MSVEISLGAGARATLASLNSIQSQANVLQRRLATGKRVGSPLDNPAAFFLAQSLTSRATQLDSLTADMEAAQSTMSTASAGIAAIQSLLSSARSLANQALLSTVSTATVTGNYSGTLTTGSQIASTFGSATRFRAGDVVTVSDGTTTATYTAANGDTVQTFLDAVNNTANLKIDASLNSNGDIEFVSTEALNITIGATMNGAGGATLSSVIGHSAGTTTYTANATRTNLAAQFDSLRTQIDQAAQDAGFNGVNLLAGSSLSLTFNETGSSQMTVTGSTITSANLSLSASANSWQNDSDVNAALSAIDSAIDSLEATTATFSSMATVISARSEFNSQMIDTLNSGADLLTENDPNEDSAMLLALQTRQQIAATTLALVQDSQATALKLFGY
jgi:flagellin-like hook-associated protein FlgL